MKSLSKPHLYRNQYWWHCRGTNLVGATCFGLGGSPGEAYRNWLDACILGYMAANAAGGNSQ